MEYSLESIMAVGTGMTSRESAGAQNNGPIEYDGYSDGLDLDIARTSEQLHFMDTYDKLQSLHSAEKLRMIKKINAAYNNKTISNTNVANSVESFCNNAMSTEGVLTNIKEKLVEIFKRFCEFIKKCIMKFKMNIAKTYKLIYKITDGQFISESNMLLDTLYDFNSKLIVKISHASQITSDEKDIYLLIKSISDKMIQNCFSLFKIGVNDAKMELTNEKKLLKIGNSSSTFHFYDPKGLHKKLIELIKRYNRIITDDFNFKQFIDNKINIDVTDYTETRMKLKELNNGIINDGMLLENAAATFKKMTIYLYDQEEKVKERMEQEKSEKRKEELRKKWEEDFKELNKGMNSYISELDKRLDESFDKVKAASESRKQTIDKMDKLIEQVFDNI